MKCLNCNKALQENYHGCCDIKCHGSYWGKKALEIDYGLGTCPRCNNIFKKKSTNHKFCGCKTHKKTKSQTCKGCGNKFENERKKKYCTPECRERISRDKAEKAYLNKEKNCKQCGNKFIGGRTYCSKECREKFYESKNPIIKKKCPNCKSDFTTKQKTNRIFCTPKCGRMLQRKTHEEFMFDFFQVHKGNIVPIELYKGSDFPLRAICLHCGSQMCKPSRRYIGKDKSGCSNCKKSRGESQIRAYLTNIKIIFNEQVKFDGLNGIGGRPLTYDFYIPSLNLLIEYQGEYHDGNAHRQTKEELKRQQEHDRRKQAYAEANNIDLLEIWHWDVENIDEILNSKLNTYKSIVS